MTYGASAVASGSGINVATDTISTKAYQLMKTVDPTTDSEAPIGVSANPFAVKGKSVRVAKQFVRASGTTNYAANAVISPATAAALDFANAVRINGGDGYISQAMVVTNNKLPTNRTKLLLYSAAPTAIADQTVNSFLVANKDNYLGVIDFDGFVTEDTTASDGAYTINTRPGISFTAGSGTTTIYGVLVTKDVFTPTAGQQFTVTLQIEQN